MGRKSKKPPRKQCPYGFTCSQMTSQPNTIAENCLFLQDCKKMKQDSNSDSKYTQNDFLREISRVEKEISRVEKEISQVEKEIGESLISTRYSPLAQKQEAKSIRKRLFQRKKFLDRIIVHKKAVFELIKFGNPQLAKNFGIDQQIRQIRESLKRIKTQLNNYNGLSNINRGYIAPKGVEVHTYNTKHPPSGKFPPETPLEEIRKQQTIYKYHKLLSTTAQFESETTDSRKRKVIHLGKHDSEKNIQARLGIERRNRLAKIRTLTTQASKALHEAAELVDEVLCFEDFRGNDETPIDSE